jgi:hypothetical protein
VGKNPENPRFSWLLVSDDENLRTRHKCFHFSPPHHHQESDGTRRPKSWKDADWLRGLVLIQHYHICVEKVVKGKGSAQQL